MVTAYPSYPAYPAAPPAQPAGPAPVQVAVAETVPQRRATVAFRLILVIPHAFVLCFLAIAAFVIAFIGWWGALFAGRLPEFAVNFLTGYMRWALRVGAYMYLLTDVYPPFALDDTDAYPVRLEVPPPQRLNRFAVFFRFILSIPAWIVTSLVVNGVGTMVLFIAWLIALISGKLPPAMHQALTAVLRYQTRFNCYYWMLTPAYPAGLFGDAPGAPFANGGAQAGFPAPGGYGAPAPGYGAGPGYGDAPGYAAPGYGTPGSVYGAPGGYGGPGAYGPGQTVFQPASWQLILTSSARQLVTLFLVLGALTYIYDGFRGVSIVANAIHHAQSVNTTNNAIDQVNASYGTLTSNLNKWQAAVAACDKNLTCVTKADSNAATYFSAFASQLQATSMPSGATAAAGQLNADAAKAAQDFTRLSQTTTVAQYQNTFTDTGLQRTLNQFDQDYNTLGTALENS